MDIKDFFDNAPGPEPEHVTSLSATRTNLVYLSLLALGFSLPFLLPFPLNFWGMGVVGSAGVLGALYTKRVVEREHPRNEAGKLGLIVSFLMLLVSGLVLGAYYGGIAVTQMLASGAFQRMLEML